MATAKYYPLTRTLWVRDGKATVTVQVRQFSMLAATNLLRMFGYYVEGPWHSERIGTWEARVERYDELKQAENG